MSEPQDNTETRISLVDSHAHVVPSVFGDEIPQVLERASAAGVDNIVCIGSGYGDESANEAVEVAERFDQVYATVGLHPHDAKHCSSTLLKNLTESAAHPKVLAWGEIGLDFHYDNSPREEQTLAFSQQLKAAAELDLPVVIHSRAADQETVEILDAEDAWERGVLIHCFSHTPEFARQLLDRGAYLSIPGIVTFKRAEALRQAVELIPLNRLMIETDSPFLTPMPHRGKRNEPAYVRLVAEFISELTDVPLLELATETSNNAAKFFGFDLNKIP